jgi:hypothetical protein
MSQAPRPSDSWIVPDLARALCGMSGHSPYRTAMHKYSGRRLHAEPTAGPLGHGHR